MQLHLLRAAEIAGLEPQHSQADKKEYKKYKEEKDINKGDREGDSWSSSINKARREEANKEIYYNNNNNNNTPRQCAVEWISKQKVMTLQQRFNELQNVLNELSIHPAHTPNPKP